MQSDPGDDESVAGSTMEGSSSWDMASTKCMVCNRSFSVLFRRHHCRQCGGAVCAAHGSTFMQIPFFQEPVRVCDICVVRSKHEAENQPFERQSSAKQTTWDWQSTDDTDTVALAILQHHYSFFRPFSTTQQHHHLSHSQHHHSHPHSQHPRTPAQPAPPPSPATATTARRTSTPCPGELPESMQNVIQPLPTHLRAPLLHAIRVLGTLHDAQHPAWKTVTSRNGVELQKRNDIEPDWVGKGISSNGGNGGLWREMGVVAEEPRKVLDFLSDVTMRPDWDRSCRSECVVRSFSPNVDIVTTFHHGRSPLSARVFVCVRARISFPLSVLCRNRSSSTYSGAGGPNGPERSVGSSKFAAGGENDPCAILQEKRRKRRRARRYRHRAHAWCPPAGDGSGHGHVGMKSANTSAGEDGTTLGSRSRSVSPHELEGQSTTNSGDDETARTSDGESSHFDFLDVIPAESSNSSDAEGSGDSSKQHRRERSRVSLQSLKHLALSPEEMLAANTQDTAKSSDEDMVHMIATASVKCPVLPPNCGVLGTVHVGGFIIKPHSQFRSAASASESKKASIVVHMTQLSYGSHALPGVADKMFVEQVPVIEILRSLLYRGNIPPPLPLQDATDSANNANNSAPPTPLSPLSPTLPRTRTKSSAVQWPLFGAQPAVSPLVAQKTPPGFASDSPMMAQHARMPGIPELAIDPGMQSTVAACLANATRINNGSSSTDPSTSSLTPNTTPVLRGVLGSHSESASESDHRGNASFSGITANDVEAELLAGATPFLNGTENRLSSSTIGSEATVDIGSLPQFVQLFNRDPFKAITQLVAHNLITNHPAAIASFLLCTRGLSRIQVGAYLGRNSPENMAVLEAYTHALDFTNMDLVDAMRVFVKGFSLPGEAQIIDRLMQSFAKRYMQCNRSTRVNSVRFATAESISSNASSGSHTTPLRSEDAAYVLAFSLILLNTDLHNPQLKRKIKHMTAEEFVSNNRGINDGTDLPEAYLLRLYNNIAAKEIRVGREGKSSAGFVSVMSDTRMQGWVQKKSYHMGVFRTRWCALKDSCLFVYLNPDDSDPTTIVPLENVGLRDKGRFGFELFSAIGGKITCYVVEDSQNALVPRECDSVVFRVRSKAELRQWNVKLRRTVFLTPVLPDSRIREHGNKVLDLKHTPEYDTSTKAL